MEYREQTQRNTFRSTLGEQYAKPDSITLVEGRLYRTVLKETQNVSMC